VWWVIIPRATQPPEATPVVQPTPEPITVSAVLVPSERARMGFAQPGRVAEVFVNEGQAVEAGQPLLRMQGDEAQRRLHEAEASLAVQQSRLAMTEAPPRPEALAAVNAELEAAMAQHDIVVRGATEADVAQARQAFDTAAAERTSAEAALDQLLTGPTRAAHQQASSALSRTRAEVAAAEARLSDVEAGPTREALEVASSAVEADRATLTAADAGLKAFAMSSEAEIRAARSEVDTQQAAHAAALAALRSFDAQSPADVQAAQSAYLAALARRDAALAALRDAEQPPIAALAAAESEAVRARAALASADASAAAVSEGVSPQSPCFQTDDGVSFDRDASPIDAAACDAAETAAQRAVDSASAAVRAADRQLDQVRAGGTLAAREQLVAALKQAEQDVALASTRAQVLHTGGAAAAREGLVSQAEASRAIATAAEARLSAHLTARDAEGVRLEAEVVAARERLRADEARLEQVLASPTAAERQAAQSAAVSARAAAVAAEAALIDLEGGPTAAEVAAARAAFEAASAAVSAADARLAEVLRGARSEEIRAATAAVTRAGAQRDLLIAGPSDSEREVARAQLRHAEAQTEAARDALRDTVLVAPFDGTVTEVLVRRGEASVPGQAAVSVGDVRHLLLETSDLDQSQLGGVVEGQPATVMFDAVPDARFAARVVRIALMASTGPGGTNFTLTLELDQTDARLRWGMTSTIELVPTEPLP
jgi:multidrug resistance efflux pump